MIPLKRVLIAAAFMGTMMLSAQSPTPTLEPGEGLAFLSEEGAVSTAGDASREAPMGSLAKLVWLRLEGADWLARGVEFHCTGSWHGMSCWNREGHGQVDLEKGINVSCNLAFLCWARESLDRHRAQHGEDWARSRVGAAFRPFLGARGMTEGQPIFLGAAWVGDGDLLRTSPEAFLHWLRSPEQSTLLTFLAAHMETSEGWWMKTGTGPVPGRAGLTSAWVAGGNGARLAVLHLPEGRGKAEGLARFRALCMSVPATEDIPAPFWIGDPDQLPNLEAPLAAALEGTAAYGPWLKGAWRIQLHLDAASFERATGAPPQRAASWVGNTLHLRPWDQLRRRDLGGVLRHELVHRRLMGNRLHRWEEEARCIWAESHTRPPAAWPSTPEAHLQDRLDLALSRGTTESQTWAYRWLRAWVEGRPTPPPPEPPAAEKTQWQPLPATDLTSAERRVRITWPEARLPNHMSVNGKELAMDPGETRVFSGRVQLGGDSPVPELEGRVELKRTSSGWALTWETLESTWIAAALAGELGHAPFEAKRALASVLSQWLKGHREGQHADGDLCPLTHCAVVRGLPKDEDLRAAKTAPLLNLDPQWAFFTASAGGVSLSPHEVWGSGPDIHGSASAVHGDAWATWDRTLTATQVQRLKQAVRPGAKPGQRILFLGPSGPYPIESLRITAGRLFGWTTWPSNVCEGENLPDGSIHLRGHGWGHNAGLCLATAIQRASEGWPAERILAEAFPPDSLASGEGHH